MSKWQKMNSVAKPKKLSLSLNSYIYLKNYWKPFLGFNTLCSQGNALKNFLLWPITMSYVRIYKLRHYSCLDIFDIIAFCPNSTMQFLRHYSPTPFKSVLVCRNEVSLYHVVHLLPKYLLIYLSVRQSKLHNNYKRV